jgi:hypothetical protein
MNYITIAVIHGILVLIVGGIFRSRVFLVLAAILSATVGVLIGNPNYLIFDLLGVIAALIIGFLFIPTRTKKPRGTQPRPDKIIILGQVILILGVLYFLFIHEKEFEPKTKVIETEQTKEIYTYSSKQQKPEKSKTPDKKERIDSTPQANIQEPPQKVNEDILFAQRKLKELGYYEDEIDGVLGKNMKRAIAWFQRDLGMRITGLLDAETIYAIKNVRVLEPEADTNNVKSEDRNSNTLDAYSRDILQRFSNP